MNLGSILGGLIKPAAEAFKSRNERKAVEKSLEAKIAEKKIDATAQVTFNDQEWERLAAWSNESTWKDEYVTVSVLAIWNFIVIGALLSAFGYPQMLEGIKLAMITLNDVGVDVGSIMKITILAALGIYALRKW